MKGEIKNRTKEIYSKLQSLSFGKLSVKDQSFFAKRLSLLIKAGLPILDSLMVVRDQSESRRHSKIYDQIVADISNGQYLSSSLSKFKNVFGEFAVNIIRVGETGGILSENLEYLSDELKKKMILRRKIISAFVYPVVVTLATFGITAFLMVYLFPKIVPVFLSLHIKLPLSTRILIFVSNSFRDHWSLIILGLFVLVVSFFLALNKIQKFRFLIDSLILKFPIVGKMAISYNLANASRTLGLLLKSGLTPSESIPILSATTENLVYKKEFSKVSQSVNKGERISSHLKKRPEVFPDIFSQIVSVGERSGSLAESLLYLSDLYDNEVDEFNKNLSSLMEPILMVFMGILVGFVAISIITPIYGITQGLHS